MHDTPAWFTVNVWPPAVIVAVRAEALVLAATENATVPLPLPLLPEVTVTQALPNSLGGVLQTAKAA